MSPLTFVPKVSKTHSQEKNKMDREGGLSFLDQLSFALL